MQCWGLKWIRFVPDKCLNPYTFCPSKKFLKCFRIDIGGKVAYGYNESMFLYPQYLDSFLFSYLIPPIHFVFAML